MKSYKVFISYSYKDEEYKRDLVTHLASLKRKNVITEWHEGKIVPGQESREIINDELLNSDIILLLISSDFIASDNHYNNEMKKAIERHEKGLAKVVPIIIRPCDWQELSFGKIQELPFNGEPLSIWNDRDKGLLNIVNGIKSIIEKGQIPLDKLEKKQKKISYPFETIIGRLPRGFILIKDLELKGDDSWTITAFYNDYDEDKILGSTHYHNSDNRTWNTLNGRTTQYTKLKIPKGDWAYASTFLYLIMEINERGENCNFEKIVNKYKMEYEYIDFYKKGEKIPIPKVPAKFMRLNKTGEIRDIIEELNDNYQEIHLLARLHEHFESIGRKLYLKTFELLGLNHPALKFVKETIDEYDRNFDQLELKRWNRKLIDVLTDVCKHVK